MNPHRSALLGFLFLLLLGVCSARAGVEATLYVSSSGSGSSFSQTQPGNLFAARNQIETMSATMTGDIVVYLYGGAYQLPSTFQLSGTSNDSGAGGHNIIYEAYPGQVPVLSGGMVVTGWTLYNSGSNIWRAQVGTGINSRQLYVNGVRAIRARGPLSPSGFTATSTGFTTTNTAMQTWGNQSDIEIVDRNDWKQLRCEVSSISGSNIVMQQPGWSLTYTSPKPGPPLNGDGTVSLTSVSWVENAFALLTSPGMWYLDQTAGYLYYIPRPGENMATATVVLPTLQMLVQGTGGSLTTPLHNVIFSGITFEYATWLGPSTSLGYADNQAAILWSNATTPLKTPGNLSFQTVNNIQLLGCVFEHMGGVAVDFGGGAQSNSIIGNHIEDISSGGIGLGEVTDYATTNALQMTNSNSIEDNYIRRVGIDFEDAVSIWVGYAENTVIANNDLDNQPYSGMSVGWGWGTSSYAQNNQTYDNEIGSCMQILSDGGSFYTMSSQTGSQVDSNYIKDSGDQGIYWDEGTEGYTAAGNVLDSTEDAWVLFHSSGSNNLNNYDNTANGNFSNTTYVQLSSPGANDVVENTVQVTGEQWPAAAQSVIASAGLSPGYGSVALSDSVINDADSACAYTGSWSYISNSTYGDYDNDIHSTPNDGDSIDCTFLGTAVSAVCETSGGGGNVDVYLDGAYQATVSASGAALAPQQTIYGVSGLEPVTHDLRLVKEGGQSLAVDAFVVQNPQTVMVNDTEPCFTHVPGDWSYNAYRKLGDYQGDVHYSYTMGQNLQYTFSGTGITWIGEMNTDEGSVEVYIDGVYQTTVNCYSATRIAQANLYTAQNLSVGSHTLELYLDSGGFMIVDAFAVTPVNFWLTALPTTATLNSTGNTSAVVEVRPVDGFQGPVTLGATNLPAGCGASFNPPTVTGLGFSTVTITGSSPASPGNSIINITGDGGGVTNAVTFALSDDMLPPPWADLDIGAPPIAGVAAYAGGVFSVSGNGADIYGTADQFNYAWQPVAGNTTVIAEVTSQQNTNPWAKAGIMIRSDTSAAAEYAAIYVTATTSHGVDMQYRNSIGGNAVDLEEVSGPAAPWWLKLVRNGNTFTGYQSSNGGTWTLTGSTSIAMSNTCLAGLAVCSHATGALSTATFSNVSVTFPDFAISAAPASQTVTAGTSATYTIGIAGTNGFSSTVGFNVTGLPAGASAIVSPATVTASGSTVLTIDTSPGTPIGSGVLTITGTSAGVPHTAQATLTVQAPITAWQSAWFGTAAPASQTGDLVVNNQAGISNLAAYALGLDPFTAGAGSLPAVGTATVSGSNYLSLTFTRNQAATDVTYTVQGSSGITGGWIPLSTFSNGAWSPSFNVTDTGTSPNATVTVRDTQPVGSTPSRFLKLEITH